MNILAVYCTIVPFNTKKLKKRDYSLRHCSYEKDSKQSSEQTTTKSDDSMTYFCPIAQAIVR